MGLNREQSNKGYEYFKWETLTPDFTSDVSYLDTILDQLSSQGPRVMFESKGN